MDPRIWRKRRAEHTGRISCRRKICCAAIRKVRLRDSLECIIAGAAACAAQVLCGEQRPVPALCTIGVSAGDVHEWRPGESRMDIEDTAYRPTANDFFLPALAL